MSRDERLYQLRKLLLGRKSISIQKIIADLETSRATAVRDIQYLRDRFGFPIRWDAETRGYKLESESANSADVELPGLWFNASEIHALLTMDQLLRNLEPGILRSHIEPLQSKLQEILGVGDHSLTEIDKRVRVLPMSARRVHPKNFEVIATALLSRRKLHISYFSRSAGEGSERDISPQRLVHYRDNWYLDAWCHSKRGLRMFAVDSIESARILNERARDVAEADLRAVLEAGYGIFSGRRTKIARLRFTPERARWVAKESWHPRQRSWWDQSGRYILEFPYSNHPELLMDILRHVPEIEVLAPKSLRNLLKDRIEQANRLYLKRSR
jgi:predicted DNA-binding transcriptional regulator YafY